MIGQTDNLQSRVAGPEKSLRNIIGSWKAKGIGNGFVQSTGQGTGLGLSLSYDVIKAHGCTINIETKEGEGSVVCSLKRLADVVERIDY